MSELQALIMGLIQGLTEYLPVSSSGHLTICGTFFGLNGEDNLAFTIAVHVATVLSTLVILRKKIWAILKGIFDTTTPLWSKERRYAACILISMIPVGRLKEAFIIGLAQAAAVMPGLSRSGSTIATGQMVGCKKEDVAEFSFLMVIPPILGEALLDVLKMLKGGTEAAMGSISMTALSVGFVAAFISGCIACKWMIALVKRGRLIWFAIYCAIVGSSLLIYSLL